MFIVTYVTGCTSNEGTTDIRKRHFRRISVLLDKCSIKTKLREILLALLASLILKIRFWKNLSSSVGLPAKHCRKLWLQSFSQRTFPTMKKININFILPSYYRKLFLTESIDWWGSFIYPLILMWERHYLLTILGIKRVCHLIGEQNMYANTNTQTQIETPPPTPTHIKFKI